MNRGTEPSGVATPLRGVEVLSRAPVLMTPAERIVLYATVIGRRPARVLEIGTHKGGSAMIICAALDELGSGRLVCVDPRPLVADEDWRAIQHRSVLLAGASPAVLTRAVEAAAGPFDLALIDGDHEYAGALADIEAVLPLLAAEAYLLFHDAHYWQVRDAIDHALAAHAELIDCGYLSAEETREAREERGHAVVWGGLRALRYIAPNAPASRVSAPVTQGASSVESVRESLPPPAFSGGAPRDEPSDDRHMPDDERVRSYDNAFRRAARGTRSIYGAPASMPPIAQAAHERRMALLDALPIGDLAGRTVVDFGVGSWGFACVYPKLQHCGLAIGIDISHEAIAESQRASEAGAFPYGKSFRYLTSRGEALDLESASVDLLFAGESIEHVDHPEGFLDEVYRVLKPAGQFVLTTPNADAYLSARAGEVCTIGPEHIGLMGYGELRELLEPRFEVLRAHGYNVTLHHTLDHLIDDLAFARRWAGLFEEAPHLASGVVLLLRRHEGHAPRQYRYQHIHHDSPAVRYKGAWERAPLHQELTGRLGSASGRSACELTASGDGVILQFWAHDWSGEALVSVDGDVRARVGLYSPLGGFRVVHLRGLGEGEHRVEIRAGDNVDPRSHGDQVVWHQAITYGPRDAGADRT
ncbi:MAG: class I SAM-dependent methyltransferase [Vicinamibacteraceae bacterium]